MKNLTLFLSVAALTFNQDANGAQPWGNFRGGHGGGHAPQSHHFAQPQAATWGAAAAAAQPHGSFRGGHGGDHAPQSHHFAQPQATTWAVAAAAAQPHGSFRGGYGGGHAPQSHHFAQPQAATWGAAAAVAQPHGSFRGGYVVGHAPHSPAPAAAGAAVVAQEDESTKLATNIASLMDGLRESIGSYSYNNFKKRLEDDKLPIAERAKIVEALTQARQRLFDACSEERSLGSDEKITIFHRNFFRLVFNVSHSSQASSDKPREIEEATDASFNFFLELQARGIDIDCSTPTFSGVIDAVRTLRSANSLTPGELRPFFRACFDIVDSRKQDDVIKIYRLAPALARLSKETREGYLGVLIELRERLRSNIHDDSLSSTYRNDFVCGVACHFSRQEQPIGLMRKLLDRLQGDSYHFNMANLRLFRGYITEIQVYTPDSLGGVLDKLKAEIEESTNIPRETREKFPHMSENNANAFRMARDRIVGRLYCYGAEVARTLMPLMREGRITEYDKHLFEIKERLSVTEFLPSSFDKVSPRFTFLIVELHRRLSKSDHSVECARAFSECLERQSPLFKELGRETPEYFAHVDRLIGEIPIGSDGDSLENTLASFKRELDRINGEWSEMIRPAEERQRAMALAVVAPPVADMGAAPAALAGPAPAVAQGAQQARRAGGERNPWRKSRHGRYR